MSVVGFNDVPLSDAVVPPLTAVRIPFAELGRKAADLVLHLTGNSSSEQIAETVRLELIRRSTA